MLTPGTRAASFAAALVLLALAGTALALQVPPAPTRRINDYSGALAAGDVERLETQLARRESGNTNQVAVAIFRSLEGESLEDFSVRLAEQWRIGQKGQDNGVIFLVFVDDRKMRIEVGYGLEATLTDAIAAAILRNDVAPRFREGKMADGIAAGLTAIDRAIAGQYEGKVARPAAAGGLPWPVVAALAGFGVFGAWTGFMAWARRRRGFTGGRSGWVTPGQRARGSGWAAPWFGGTGGGGGGWSSGGGGDSGFSGGGGDFGGGGASGEW